MKSIIYKPLLLLIKKLEINNLIIRNPEKLKEFSFSDRTINLNESLSKTEQDELAWLKDYFSSVDTSIIALDEK